MIPSLDDYGPYNVSFTTGRSPDWNLQLHFQVYNLEDARAPPLAVDPTTFLNGSYLLESRPSYSAYLLTLRRGE